MNKKQFLDKFLEIWSKYPHLRFCQLIANAAGNNSSQYLYYMKDEDFLESLETYSNERQIAEVHKS